MALSKIQTSEMLDTPNLGRRNLVINGAMQVTQRGPDINDIANDSTYIMDRFLTRNYGGNGTYDYDQSTDVPTATFKNSIKLTCKSASTNTGTAGYSLEQRIEGFNIRQLRLGRSNAQPFTISFWVKSSIAGTYSTGVRTTSAEYSYVTEFALSANTWTYVTYTAPALTTSLSSLNEDSGGAGLLVDLVGLGKQTNKETSTLNAWQAGNKVNSSNQVAWMDNVNATLYVTGVQLEAGDTATDFEHRSFGEELTACQRYFEKLGRGGGYAADRAYNHSNRLVNLPTWATTKRVDPTVTIYANDGTASAMSGYSSGTNNSVTSLSDPNQYSLGRFITLANGITQPHIGYFHVDAEL